MRKIFKRYLYGRGAAVKYIKLSARFVPKRRKHFARPPPRTTRARAKRKKTRFRRRLLTRHDSFPVAPSIIVSHFFRFVNPFSLSTVSRPRMGGTAGWVDNRTRHAEHGAVGETRKRDRARQGAAERAHRTKKGAKRDARE